MGGKFPGLNVIGLIPSGILVFPAVIAIYYKRFSNSLLNEIPVEPALGIEKGVLELLLK